MIARVKDLRPTYTDIKIIVETKKGQDMKYLRVDNLFRDYSNYKVVRVCDYDKYKITVITIKQEEKE